MQKIFANFNRMSEARKAVEALKQKGYKRVHLDAIENLSGEYSKELGTSDIYNIPNLAEAMLAPKGRAYRAPCIAFDPAIRCIGDHEKISDTNTRLWVFVDDGNSDEVKNLIRNLGGTFQEYCL